MNTAVVRGSLSSDPRVRDLPSGSRLVSLELTVRTEGAPTDSVPVAWLDPSPAALEPCRAGVELVVVGRVRRRFFRAGGATASATEIVAEHVVPARRRARVAKVLAEAAAAFSAEAAAS